MTRCKDKYCCNELRATWRHHTEVKRSTSFLFMPVIVCLHGNEKVIHLHNILETCQEDYFTNIFIPSYVQWNLSVTTTSIIKVITYDLVSNVF